MSGVPRLRHRTPASGGELDYIRKPEGFFSLYFDTGGTSLKLRNCS